MDAPRIVALLSLRYADAPFTAAQLADYLNTGSRAASALRLALAETARLPFAYPVRSSSVTWRLKPILDLPVRLGEREVKLWRGMSPPGTKGYTHIYRVQEVIRPHAASEVQNRLPRSSRSSFSRGF